MMNNLNPNKAPGIDGIPTTLVKASKYVIRSYLAKMITKLF